MSRNGWRNTVSEIARCRSAAAGHLGAQHVAHQATAGHREGLFACPDHRRRPVVAAQHAREPQPGAPAGAAAAAKQRSTRPGGAARKGVRPTVWWSDGRAEAVGRWLQSPSASSLMMMPLARRRSGAAVSPWPMQHGAQTLTEQLRAYAQLTAYLGRPVPPAPFVG